MKELCTQLQTLQGQGTSLMITPSRRTGDDNLALFMDSFETHNTSTTTKNNSVFIWDGAGENPYHAMLGWADYILVTADSASMLSDAGTTGKPVYIIPLEGGHKRIDKLHTNLIHRGVAKVFDGTLESWRYERLKDAQLVADAIQRYINNKRA